MANNEPMKMWSHSQKHLSLTKMATTKHTTRLNNAMSLSSDVTVATSIFYIQSVVLAHQRISIRTGNISASSTFGPRSPAAHAVVLPSLWIRTVRAEAAVGGRRL